MSRQKWEKTKNIRFKVVKVIIFVLFISAILVCTSWRFFRERAEQRKKTATNNTFGFSTISCWWCGSANRFRYCDSSDRYNCVIFCLVHINRWSIGMILMLYHFVWRPTLSIHLSLFVSVIPLRAHGNFQMIHSIFLITVTSLFTFSIILNQRIISIAIISPHSKLADEE